MTTRETLSPLLSKLYEKNPELVNQQIEALLALEGDYMNIKKLLNQCQAMQRKQEAAR